MEPGSIYTYYHEGHRVTYLIVLLSSDREPGWETSKELWRCAQFQIDNSSMLLGAQIVIHIESELRKMIEHKTLASTLQL